MQSPSGIIHNLQPREENAYPVSEGELDALTSFSFTASVLAGIGTMFLGVSLSAAQQASKPWNVSDCIVVIGSAALALGLLMWSAREAWQCKALLQRIKRRPKPKPITNGN